MDKGQYLDSSDAESSRAAARYCALFFVGVGRGVNSSSESAGATIPVLKQSAAKLGSRIILCYGHAHTHTHTDTHTNPLVLCTLHARCLSRNAYTLGTSAESFVFSTS